MAFPALVYVQNSCMNCYMQLVEKLKAHLISVLLAESQAVGHSCPKQRLWWCGQAGFFQPGEGAQ